MRYEDIAIAIREGRITIDNCGHCIHGTTEAFLDKYQRTLEMANGKNDGNWDTSGKTLDKDWDADMRRHYQRILDWDSEENDGMIGFENEEYCSGCGHRLRYVYDDGDRLELCHYFDNGHKRHIGRCKFETSSPFVGKIKIASKLVISNFFLGFRDAPEGKGHTHEFDLCCTSGRRNIGNYKLTQNIAFGQMSNMSIGVYVHPNSKSIIIGDPYLYDHKIEELLEDIEDEDEQDRIYEENKTNTDLTTIEGHKLVGTVCLDVWRFEATDLITIQPHLAEIQERGCEMVELDVPHGDWKFEHLYDSAANSDFALMRGEHPPYDPIYARLYLEDTK